MVKLTNQLEYGLFFWQIFLLVLLIFIVYSIVRLYKKVMRYLDNKTEAKRHL